MLALVALDGQRGLNGVLNVVPIHQLMNAHALLADGVKKGRRVAGENLADGCVHQHRVQSANSGCQFFRGTAAAGALDRFNRVAHAVDRIPNRMRKIPTEKQKLEDAIGS